METKVYLASESFKIFTVRKGARVLNEVAEVRDGLESGCLCRYVVQSCEYLDGLRHLYEGLRTSRSRDKKRFAR